MSFTEFPEQFTPKPLADNVYLVPVFVGFGAIYNVLIVTFDDYAVVMEAPLSDLLSQAVMGIMENIAPGKPIKYFVPTHYHFDHIGGINAYVASGSKIVTTPGNKGFFEKIAATKHTLVPNALSTNKQKPVIDTFRDKKVFSDNQHSLELYSIGPTSHVDEIIIGYLPKEKILFVSDLFNAPPSERYPPDGLALEFVQKLEKLNLDVEVIAPGHGQVITMDEFHERLNVKTSIKTDNLLRKGTKDGH